MAQRRTKNRHSSTRRSSNISGFNENTDIIDNVDPLWYDRTIVRPSTSFDLTKHASSVLNSDSTTNGMQISDGWFNNLTQSDSSKLMEQVVRKNMNTRSKEQNNKHNEDQYTESDSDQGFRKKRSKFGLNKNKRNNTDNQNVFLQALEKSIDSPTKNLTNLQKSARNESVSTNDDSKTIRKLRPNIFKTKKSLKNNTINFDDVFYSESGSEKNDTTQKTNPSPKKRKTNSNNISNILQKSTNKNVSNNSSRSNNKTVVEPRESNLHSENTLSTVNSSIKKTQPKSDTLITQSVANKINKSNSLTENSPKKRHIIFSQEEHNKQKHRSNQNLFDAVFQEHESDLNNENFTIESGNISIQKQINETENSSIPKNIRRTRQLSEIVKETNDKKFKDKNKNIPDKPTQNKSIENLSQNSEVTLKDPGNETQLEENLPSPENNSKIRKQLSKRKKVSLQNISSNISQNQLSTSNNTSKADEVSKIQNDSSNKSHNKSKNSLRSINASVTHEQTEIDSNKIISENETSTLPKYIRRTRSQVVHITKSINSKESNNEISNDANVSKDKSSQVLDNSERLTSKSNDRSLGSKETNSNINNVTKNQKISFYKVPQVSVQKLSKTQTSNYSNYSANENEKENQSNQTNEKLQNSEDKINTKEAELSENSRTSTSVTTQTKNKRTLNLFKTKTFQDIRNKSSGVPINKSSSTDDFVEDLLRTPHPAQSTLNPSGRPVTRVTQFSYVNSDIDETSSSQGSTRHSLNNIKINSTKNKRSKNISAKINSILHETNNPPLEKQQQNENHSENLSSEEEPLPSLNIRSINSEKTNNISTIKDTEWEEIKKKMNLIKEETLTRLEREKENQRKLEQEKARTEAKVIRSLALKKAELRKKNLKPKDKAFYINGKLYKQPKLPKPKNWVTDRLYKHLWKCMEPKFGLSTRIKSEKFIIKLSEVCTVIVRRKKYENYVGELNNLLKTMAKLKIIKNRYDFYRFCSEFMPYNFRIKVVPMKLPGNKKNIPYDPKLVNEPILNESNESDNN